MSKIFCISYSDYGFVLNQLKFSIKTVQLTDILFENILSCDDIEIRRRFVNVPRLFDDDHSEPLLPDDCERFLMTYKNTKVKVIDSYIYAELSKDKEKDEFGFILMEEEQVTCNSVDLEYLAEDLVLLASDGIDLNDITLAESTQGV